MAICVGSHRSLMDYRHTGPVNLSFDGDFAIMDAGNDARWL